jgi:hypothetical protein
MTAINSQKQVRAVLKDEVLKDYKRLMEATGITVISDAIAYTSKFIPFIIAQMNADNTFNATTDLVQITERSTIIENDPSVVVEF